MKLNSSQRQRLKEALQKAKDVKSKGKASANERVTKKQTQEKPKSTQISTASASNASVPDQEPINTDQKQKLSDLQQRMHRKLAGAKFRWINEQLYTLHSSKAKTLFSNQPDLFQIYHQGFNTQVKDWPVNPVDVFISDLKKCPQGTVVADMGCGEAKLAQQLAAFAITVHSFDLVAPELPPSTHKSVEVTPCDIAHVPLGPSVCDVVVFCLALMGTNVTDFIVEAHRILKKRGTLKIAEVVSRIEDLQAFIESVSAVGFRLVNKDASNKMFVALEFVKTSAKAGKTSPIVLKPCLYKRR